jgi:hypothetical protein
MSTNNETDMSGNENNNNNVKEEFFKIIREFVPDLLNTFPEYTNTLDKGILDVLEEKYDTEHANNLFEHCKSVFPERFFDILYQNDEMFSDEKINSEFLPNIDFSDLWKQEISDNTRSVIWKYLQLILFSLITSVQDGSSFGDTAKLFEAINEDEFKHKIEETLANMQTIFENQTDNSNNNFSMPNMSDISNINLENLPNPEDVQNHINGMLGGKLGNLAKEIAEETAQELDVDMENATDVNDVFKKMFKNPGKLMSLVKNIGNKLESKLKSGDLNESELIKEATDMMSKMKGMPGMQNIEKMLGQFGLPMGKNAKVNMGQFQNHMKQNLQASQQRERMLRKLEERKKQRQTQQENNNQHNLENQTIEHFQNGGIKQTGENEFVFSTGEKMEKSKKQNPNKTKPKKCKKKKKR